MPKCDSDVLVSVIVPAYNVEKYIEKCVRSIMDQSYKCLEILVVNDGSTDDTAKVLQKLLDCDVRVRIIHQSNQGVSAARNAGLDASKGAYIVFVDGDDYIAEDYVAYMLSASLQLQCEMFVSKNCFSQKAQKQTSKEAVCVLTPEEATALLLSPEVIVGCWNKMFQRRFLDDHVLRFSADLSYGEGLVFITSAAQLAKRIGVGNRKVYYYRRNHALSATNKFDMQRLYNGEKALHTIENHLRIRSQAVDTALLLHKSMFYLGALTRMEANRVKQQYLADYKRWHGFIRRNYIKLFLRREVSLYRKMLLLGGCICPWMMMKLDALRRKRIAANSID